MTASSDLPTPDNAESGGAQVEITPELVVSSSVRLSGLTVDRGQLWWAELRPEDHGRTQIVRQLAAGTMVEVLPDGHSTRSKVHEYGGGSWWVHEGVLFFVEESDQRIWRLAPGEQPAAITPAPGGGVQDRYADGVVTSDGRWIVCVRERHHSSGGQPTNELVVIEAWGGAPPEVVATGADFYAAPRISDDDQTLCWIQWNHPDMPWDATELWLADVTSSITGCSVSGQRQVAGGGAESLVEPHWVGDELFVSSDSIGWWNLCRVSLDDGDDGDDGAKGEVLVPVAPVEAEIGGPMWTLGNSSVAHLSDGSIVVAATRDGATVLGMIPAGGSEVTELELDLELSAISDLCPVGASLGFASDRVVAFIGASPVTEPQVMTFDLGSATSANTSATTSSTDERTTSGELKVVRPARDLGIDPAGFVRPDHLEIPVGDRHTYALVYLPDASDGPDGLPGLIVNVHGGPTASARNELRLETQFWLSQGIGVAEVNYAGSTGYGRAHRDLLQGRWGVIDTEDCVAVARHLAAEGRVDPERLLIRGGSAGGFTALAAVVQHEVFTAASVRYAVTDLMALAADTHDFEARYLDGLLGPLPDAEEVYRERSPLAGVSEIDVPVLVLQGSEDRVVPPSQAEALVAALDEAGVDHQYRCFDGESHGFRTSAAQVESLELELAFLTRVWRTGEA